jgi:hypothetical protein
MECAIALDWDGDIKPFNPDKVIDAIYGPPSQASRQFKLLCREKLGSKEGQT